MTSVPVVAAEAGGAVSGEGAAAEVVSEAGAVETGGEGSGAVEEVEGGAEEGLGTEGGAGEDLATEEGEGVGLVAALEGSVDAVEEAAGEGVVVAEEAAQLANALLVLSSTVEDGEIEVRISVDKEGNLLFSKQFVEYWRDMLTGGFKGGKNVVIEPHRHEGVFIARGKEDVLVTLNMVPGEAVYGEKRITVEVSLTTRTLAIIAALTTLTSSLETPAKDGGADTKVEYRVWNPFRSKLAAAILGGVDQIHISPGTKVLYLGAASGTTVSHVSDIVGPDGRVMFDYCSRMVEWCLTIVPGILVEHGHLHQGILVRTLSSPSRYPSCHLHQGILVVISIKASCIDSTAQPEAVFASEVKKLQADKLKPQEQITLEPYERDHAVVVGVFRPPAKVKAS
uniref:rRNA 2'-O-methyltransferase fibrillarin n=2 Tax=Timema TaxID=61471 RepID=A0A7R9AZZ4_TIMSH|nr:unnamed protein product [Timema shepardi]